MYDENHEHVLLRQFALQVGQVNVEMSIKAIKRKRETKLHNWIKHARTFALTVANVTGQENPCRGGSSDMAQEVTESDSSG
jgi:hypothetical protein